MIHSLSSRLASRAVAPGLDVRRSTILFVIAAVMAVAPSAGCGGGADGRLPVSGSVTMNGAPLHDATIEFVPQSSGSSSFAGATILDGQYSISANRGLVPGEYKVVISMGGSTPEPPMDEPPGDPAEFPPAPELIPARYSSESTLTAKVEANGDNTFDFDLQK